MPANVVKTGRDEKLWEKAKKAAEEQGRGEDWPYVMGIYKKMKGMAKSMLVSIYAFEGKILARFV